MSPVSASIIEANENRHGFLLRRPETSATGFANSDERAGWKATESVKIRAVLVKNFDIANLYFRARTMLFCAVFAIVDRQKFDAFKRNKASLRCKQGLFGLQRRLV